jgi:hypothetical protein
VTFDPSKPVKFRNDPRAVRIVATDISGDFPILALVKDGGVEWPITRRASGCVSSYGAGNLDLVNIPQKHVFWLNIYPNAIGARHSTRELADKAAAGNPYGCNRVACLKIEFEDGEGL